MSDHEKWPRFRATGDEDVFEHLLVAVGGLDEELSLAARAAFLFDFRQLFHPRFAVGRQIAEEGEGLAVHAGAH